MIVDDGNLQAKSLVGEQVWMEVCNAAFEITLDGFCRVKKCSKDGRAAMGIDLSALHSGLDTVHPNRSPKGKAHVEALCVKVSYMQDEEVMQWVEENYHSYPYRCILGVITTKFSSLMNPKKLKDAVAVLDSLYDYKDTKDDNILSGLLSSNSSSSWGSSNTSNSSNNSGANNSNNSNISINSNSNNNSPGPSSPIATRNINTNANTNNSNNNNYKDKDGESSISNMFGSRMRAARNSIVVGMNSIRKDDE